MAFPKRHPDAAARNRAAMAAYRARQKAKSPLERFVEKEKLTFAYTPEELRELAAIRSLIAELEIRADRLNGILKERVKTVPSLQGAAAELEIGYTKVQLPIF